MIMAQSLAAPAADTESPRPPGDPLRHYTLCLASRCLLRFPEDAFLAEVYCRDTDGNLDPSAISGRAAELSRELETALTEGGGKFHPLSVLARHFELSHFELDLAVLAVLPHLDERFGDFFQKISAERGRSRITLGAALSLLIADSTDRLAALRRLEVGTLWRGGLLVLEDRRTAMFERPLIASTALALGLQGVLPETLHCGAAARLVDLARDPDRALAVSLRESLASSAGELAVWAEQVGKGVIHLPSRDRDDARLLAEATAQKLGRRLVLVESQPEILPQALREGGLAALLQGCLLALELPAGVTRVEIDGAWRPRAPVFLLTGPQAAVQVADDLQVRARAPQSPRLLEQSSIWKHFLDRVDGEANTDLLANQTRITVSQIAATVRRACALAREAGVENPRSGHVRRALAEVVPDPGSALGDTKRPRVPWSKLVLDRRSKQQLEDLVRRVEHRATVRERWSLDNREGRGNGLVALLHGESGTGKTLTVEAVTTQLYLPMISVDLSRVVSKYIGETEKHLAEIFSLAEGFRALLFFDEADALFGKRTDVGDAHDRYANIEVNFLLQRLESFDGIAVLASNLPQNLDEAFLRRLQFSVHLPRPLAGEQLLIWHQHLPLDRLAPDVRLETLTEQFDLVGGEIRNAALSAAYGAAARDGVITMSLLRDSVRLEYEKKGRPLPMV